MLGIGSKVKNMSSDSKFLLGLFIVFVVILSSVIVMSVSLSNTNNIVTNRAQDTENTTTETENMTQNANLAQEETDNLNETL